VTIANEVSVLAQTRHTRNADKSAFLARASAVDTKALSGSQHATLALTRDRCGLLCSTKRSERAIAEVSTAQHNRSAWQQPMTSFEM